MNVCENLFLLKALRLLYTGINIIRFVVPIGLLIKLMIDVYHHILNPDSKQIKELAVKRIVAAVCIFLLPIFVNFVLKLVEIGGGNKPDYPYCLTTLDNIEYFERLAEAKKVLKNETKIKKDNTDYQKAQWDQAQKLIEEAKKSVIDDTSALYLGQSYNLSDRELRGLCSVAKSEQGSIEGAKAEASLMANLYELLSTRSSYYGNGLYNYVRNGGWFSNSKSKMDNPNCPDAYLNAVRDVLVNGNRTLPFYINQHDCMSCNRYTNCSSGKKGDICSLENNGTNYTSSSYIENRNNYIKDVTKVYTIYMGGDFWVFYKFPASNSDPFGYTNSAKNKVLSMGR